MYATEGVNGSPAIRRNGQTVLSVCDQDWEFADWLCALLNESGRTSLSLPKQRDLKWLTALNQTRGRQVHNA